MHYVDPKTYANRNIIRVQSENWIVSTVERRHKCLAHIRMTESQRVAKLVGGHLKQIGATARVHCPLFLVVEMRIATVHRKVRVRQGAAWSVERIAVAVFARLEADLNVYLAGALRRERQIRVLAPHAKRIVHFLIDLVAGQSLGILGDAVGERLHLPSAALQGVPFRT